MLKSHEKFHSANGKRLVLVVDDEFINRELLNMYLEEDYQVLLAEDGKAALEMAMEQHDALALILLDLMMPVMNGIDFLKAVMANPLLQHIPVIVMTADQDSEVQCLDIGASDFIPKPYPRQEVVVARCRRTIELAESQYIIQATERDELTGLYNKEFFFRYAEQLDQFHQDMAMDAVLLDINHFHVVNERYGKAYGDDVLRRIGGKLKAIFDRGDGIVCRMEADTFLLYCPHREDYQEMLKSIADALSDEEGPDSRIRLRMGVNSRVDKTIDVERRFDRAKMAAETIRGSMTRSIAAYDSTLHEAEMYAERLVEDFRTALKEKQFKIVFQPKFDIRPDKPVLAGAEALIRWRHPEFGMISPGTFVPLFEENGLVRDMDQYVWEEAARQIRAWKDQYGMAVPVSVNVSRVDMFDPNLIGTLRSLVDKYGLEPEALHLEITESAYSEEAEQIIQTVSALRDVGFHIEMDDFGSGYSSLNMISSLPIDALKLDMNFIRTAFQNDQDTRMIEIIVDIAEYLNVPIIAEGVETEEQMLALRAMGCDLVQGYYFSKPVPPEEFSRFIEKKKRDVEIKADAPASKEKDGAVLTPRECARASRSLACGFDQVFDIDIGSGSFKRFIPEEARVVEMEKDFYARAEDIILEKVYTEDQMKAREAVGKENLRRIVSEKKPCHMTFRLLMDGKPIWYSAMAVPDRNTEDHVFIGVNNVNEQLQQEQALNEARVQRVSFSAVAEALAVDYFSIYYINIEDDSFIEFVSHKEYESLNIENQGEDFFDLSRKNIRRVICPADRDMLLASFTKENLLKEIDKEGAFRLAYRLMVDGAPIHVSLKATRMPEPDKNHIIVGISNVDAQIKREEELGLVREKVNRDELTGVKSKHAYAEREANLNQEIERGEAAPFAIVVCDVNGLKNVNDSQGHQAGDQLIRSAAMIICNIFKHSPVFRMGGDEFAVLLRGSDYDDRRALMKKLSEQNGRNKAADCVVVAGGISDYDPEKDASVADVLRRADAEMYQNKTALKAE